MEKICSELQTGKLGDELLEGNLVKPGRESDLRRVQNHIRICATCRESIGMRGFNHVLEQFLKDHPEINRDDVPDLIRVWVKRNIN